MELRTIDILATLLLNLIQYGCSEHILPCNDTIWNSGCPEHQACNSTTLRCGCLLNYVRVGDNCEKPGSGDTVHNDGGTILTIIIFTLALLIGGAILVIRKYNLMEYVRDKIESRRNNDVMYEDVMIGSDDPPLTP